MKTKQFTEKGRKFAYMRILYFYIDVFFAAAFHFAAYHVCFAAFCRGINFYGGYSFAAIMQVKHKAHSSNYIQHG